MWGAKVRQGLGEGGCHVRGRVMTAPPHSEPPLRLRAAGRQAAGGHGSDLAAHTAPAEMRRPDRAHPHVSALLSRPPTVLACHLPAPVVTWGAGWQTRGRLVPRPLFTHLSNEREGPTI